MQVGEDLLDQHWGFDVDKDSHHHAASRAGLDTEEPFEATRPSYLGAAYPNVRN
jgi:hypothetical protein